MTDTGDDVNLDKGAISRQRKRRPIYGRDVIQPIPCPSLNGLARRRDVTPLGYLVKSLASAASACFLVPRIVSYLMMRLPSSAAPTSNLIRNERLPPGDISVCGRVVQASEPLRYAFVDGLFLPDSRTRPPSYNVTPQELYVIRHNHKSGERTLDLLRWGLIPHGCQEPDGGPRRRDRRASRGSSLLEILSRDASWGWPGVTPVAILSDPTAGAP